MFRKATYLMAASALAATAPLCAATVNVDLSGASSGTLINGVGASFTQTFTGQTVSGNAVTGSPTAPLSLTTAGTIEVAFWNPGVSAASNSLLSQPNNSAPLAMLLAGNIANSLTFTAGYGNGGAFDAIAYAANGSVTGSQSFAALDGYHVYTLSGVGNFAGVLFTNNTDAAGLRFQNFSYETVGGVVPEPASWAMMIAGFGLAGASLRRRRSVALSFS